MILLRRYTWKAPLGIRLLAWTIGQVFDIEHPYLKRRSTLKEAWSGVIFYDDPWDDQKPQ